jgi:hypothetical protein
MAILLAAYKAFYIIQMKGTPVGMAVKENDGAGDLGAPTSLA